MSFLKHSSLAPFLGVLISGALLAVQVGTLTGCGSRNTQSADTAPAAVSVPAAATTPAAASLPAITPARLPEKPYPIFPTTHITGVVAAANAQGLVLSAHKITFPNGKTIPLNPARPKRLLLAPGTMLPTHLKVGSPLTAVGYDTGVGKPLKTISLNASPQVAAAAAKTYTADPAHGAFLAKLSSLAEGSVSAQAQSKKQMSVFVVGSHARSAQSHGKLNLTPLLDRNFDAYEKVIGPPKQTDKFSDWDAQNRYYKFPGLVRIILHRQGTMRTAADLRDRVSWIKIQFRPGEVQDWKEALERVGLPTDAVQPNTQPDGTIFLMGVKPSWTAHWTPHDPQSKTDQLEIDKFPSTLFMGGR